ncbi:DUF2610 domain-containing protein [Streptomyces sp. NPDC004285]
MRPFAVPCSFGADHQVPFEVYVGEPAPDAHPLEQQLAWLARERGGTMPQDAVDTFATWHAIALEHGVSTEELSAYASMEAAGQDTGSASEESG